MAVKVEVLTPTTSVSEVAGDSTIISVVRPAQSPITTNGSQAVVEVVKTVSVLHTPVVSDTEPEDPYEGMVWIEVPS